MTKNQIDSPGAQTMNPIGKTPTGAQNQGDVDVKNYAQVDTGKGSTSISTEMDCPLGDVPSGSKTGGL